MIVGIVADVVVGGVQLPKLPKLIELPVMTDAKGLLAVTVRYFFSVWPEPQVVVQETDVPLVHPQNVECEAVTPVSPVAFCAVVVIAAVASVVVVGVHPA